MLAQPWRRFNRFSEVEDDLQAHISKPMRFSAPHPFGPGIAWVKFVGTHARYDQIDVESVNEYQPIRSHEDLRDAFKRLGRVFQAADGTPAADEMEILVTLIEAYEQKHYPTGSGDPVDAIKFRMEQQGLSPKDIEPCIGSSGRVSESKFTGIFA
jgi:HTH-type transcriptional regulator/antitoxin HigA